MENEQLLTEMKCGNENAILEGLKHKGAIFRINALINIARFSIEGSEKIIDKVYDLLEDKVVVDGYEVADFAYTVLDLIGIEAYPGENERIKDLIACKLEF